MFFFLNKRRAQQGLTDVFEAIISVVYIRHDLQTINNDIE